MYDVLAKNGTGAKGLSSYTDGIKIVRTGVAAVVPVSYCVSTTVVLALRSEKFTIFETNNSNSFLPMESPRMDTAWKEGLRNIFEGV